jgi:hypothetical protein
MYSRIKRCELLAGLLTLLFPRRPLALHFLFQDPERLVDIVITNQYLQLYHPPHLRPRPVVRLLRLKEMPSANAFCRTAPSVRPKLAAIVRTGVFSLARAFSSRMFALVHSIRVLRRESAPPATLLAAPFGASFGAPFDAAFAAAFVTPFGAGVIADPTLHTRDREAVEQASRALAAAQAELAAAEERWLVLEILSEEIEGSA